ncbi:hypothetical protein LCGC14_0146630 [marine sediment metagenome]|uniref:Uncharacterized protein n=1 Tax=marine sediment metagenome TaxID=412755 RepID=A0A0F9XHK2_9ZZZZ
MGLDLSNRAKIFAGLKEHYCHEIKVVAYGECDEEPINMSIECLDCSVVLIDADSDEVVKTQADTDITRDEFERLNNIIKSLMELGYDLVTSGNSSPRASAALKQTIIDIATLAYGSELAQISIDTEGRWDANIDISEEDFTWLFVEASDGNGRKITADPQLVEGIIAAALGFERTD